MTTHRTLRTLAVASPANMDGTTEVYEGVVRALEARGHRWADRSRTLDHLDEVLPDVVERLGGEIEALGPHYRVNLTGAPVAWEDAMKVDRPSVSAA